jgi:UDPglucose 6-dehydrogenase
VDITVIGAGYVGLVTAACFAEMGNLVTCLDIDQRKVDQLQQGQIPIFEPGLQEMVVRNTQAQRLVFTTHYGQALDKPEVVFIAVGTPSGADGVADLSYVIDVAHQIGVHMQRPLVVVDKSTVPVGTADQVKAQVAQAMAARGVTIDFSVVSNPEFLKEGAAIDDFLSPNRIVIGSDNPQATQTLCKLYRPFSRNHERFVLMDVRSAELTKYAANAMLAARISFMNELANLSDVVGADIEKVRLGIGSDVRIGSHFLYAGVGYGGSCFPKDLKALLHTGTQAGIGMEMVRAIDAVNEKQKLVLVEKVKAFYGGADAVKGKVFALWGVAFKPNTDDIREAPSLVIVAALLKLGATVRAYDPLAFEAAWHQLGEPAGLVRADSAMDAARGADALLIATEWKEFRSPSFPELAKRLTDKVVFDGRNLYDRSALQAYGLQHVGIGR